MPTTTSPLRTLVTAAGLLFATQSACAQGAANQSTPLPPAPEDVPTLVVFFTIDQLRMDYFERFGSQLNGGLARLYEGGAVFTNAFHDHANTETAPGHASTMSGRFPASTGIVRNAAGVGDPQAPLVDAEGPGASPYRFRGTTLTDWLRVKDPRSRALSVSRKDKGDAVRHLRERHLAGTVCFIGDDITDEDAFRALLDGDVGIKVGEGETSAIMRLESQADVVPFLEDLASARELFPPESQQDGG